MSSATKSTRTAAVFAEASHTDTCRDAWLKTAAELRRTGFQVDRKQAEFIKSIIGDIEDDLREVRVEKERLRRAGLGWIQATPDVKQMSSEADSMGGRRADQPGASAPAPASLRSLAQLRSADREVMRAGEYA